MSKKIYLSPENRPAPHGPYTGYPGIYEHDVCCEIAEYYKAALERCGFVVEIAEPGRSIRSGETRQAYANKHGFDLYSTIHTNAGGGTGPTCLYAGAKGSESYKANQMVYEELRKLYPSKRGIVDGNGYAENNQTSMVSIYPEVAFHDNAKDAKFLVENKKAIGEALCKAVCWYFGVTYVAPKEDKPSVAGTLYRVQVGAFASKENAEKMAKELQKKGYNTVVKSE